MKKLILITILAWAQISFGIESGISCEGTNAAGETFNYSNTRFLSGAVFVGMVSNSEILTIDDTTLFKREYRHSAPMIDESLDNKAYGFNLIGAQFDKQITENGPFITFFNFKQYAQISVKDKEEDTDLSHLATLEMDCTRNSYSGPPPPAPSR